MSAREPGELAFLANPTPRRCADHQRRIRFRSRTQDPVDAHPPARSRRGRATSRTRPAPNQCRHRVRLLRAHDSVPPARSMTSPRSTLLRPGRPAQISSPPRRAAVRPAAQPVTGRSLRRRASSAASCSQTARPPALHRTRRSGLLLDHDAFDLVEQDSVRRPVVELGRLRRRVAGDPLRVLECPPVRPDIPRCPSPETCGSTSTRAAPPLPTAVDHRQPGTRAAARSRSARVSAGVSTDVALFVRTCLGPRTDAAGFTGSTWWTTSQSQKRPDGRQVLLHRRRRPRRSCIALRRDRWPVSSRRLRNADAKSAPGPRPSSDRVPIHCVALS